MAEEYEKVFKGEYGSYLDYPQNDNDKLLAGLSYILGWIVALISLLAIKPLSPYLKFHAIQALGLHIAMYIIYVAASILMMVIIGFCLLPFAMGLGIYALVVGILVLTGKDHRVPWLANYVEENYI